LSSNYYSNLITSNSYLFDSEAHFSKAVLSYKKPESTATLHDSCGVNVQRYALYKPTPGWKTPQI